MASVTPKIAQPALNMALLPSITTTTTVRAVTLGLRRTPFALARRAASSSSSRSGSHAHASSSFSSAHAFSSNGHATSSATSTRRTLYQRYQQAQRQRPYRTQVWSFLSLWLLGDLGAQLLYPAQEPDPDHPGALRPAPYDGWRTLRHLFIGATVAVPTYRWFLLIGRNFNYHSRVLSVALKVAVQQAVYTPLFNTYFFGMHALLAGKSWAETREHLQRALPKSIVNGVGVWTGAAVLNFTVVPVPLQGVVMGVTAVGWQVYLSWMNQMVALKKHEEVRGES